MKKKTQNIYMNNVRKSEIHINWLSELESAISLIFFYLLAQPCDGY